MNRIKPTYTLLFHICIWTVLFVVLFLQRSWNHTDKAALTNVEALLVLLPYVGLFYLHAYWLMPRYLFRQKIKTYAGLLLVFLLVADGLIDLVIEMKGIRRGSVGVLHAFVRRALVGFLFIIASASVGAFREKFRLEKLQKEKETEHLRTELTFLRTQVNPHFMLNVLNSMVLLARKKSDLLEPVLLELARLMNYMLYDANNARICLEDEIGYLRAYIDLQLLRFGSDVTVRFHAPERTNGSSIEPMLLIPLVENAFKHGIGLVNEPVILIDICTEGEERLKMTVRNKYNPLVREQERRPSGIGLSNLGKRLELIYPGRFELSRVDSLHVDSMEQENWFVITLNIPLQ